MTPSQATSPATAYDPTWRRLTAWLQRGTWRSVLDKRGRALLLRAWHETAPELRPFVVRWAMSISKAQSISTRFAPPPLMAGVPPLLVALYALCTRPFEPWRERVAEFPGTPDYVLHWLAREGDMFHGCPDWLVAVAGHLNAAPKTLAYLRAHCMDVFIIWYAVDMAQRLRRLGPYTP